MSQPIDLDQLYQLFGGVGQRGQPGQGGGDTFLILPISLVEAAHGAEREISFTSERPCGECKSTGGAPGATAEVCNGCLGKGMIQTSAGFVVMSQPCTLCDGKKQIWSARCVSCDGQGLLRHPTTLKVVVPAGIADGQILRLPGQGNDYGSGPGDLRLNLQVTPHPTLTRQGDDLLTVAAIDPALAHAGGELVVPWLEGSARVPIPAHSRRGTVIRLAGWGAVRFGSPVTPPPNAVSEGVYRGAHANRGDLVVTLGPLAAPAAKPTGPRNILLAATAATVATAIAAFFLSR